MYTTLQTGQLLQRANDLNNPLRTEFTWSEVAKGLGRIVFGNVLMVSSLVLGVAVVVVVLTGHELDLFQKKVSHDTADLVVFFALIFMGIGCLISYALIWNGHWRCLKNVPDRQHAKWMMFACMVCLTLGPALNVASGFLGGDEGKRNARQFQKHGRDAITELEFNSTPAIMQLTGSGLALASSVFFLLFLRAVASCFNSAAGIWAVQLYLIYSLGLMAATFVVATGPPRLLHRPDIILGLAGGWVLSGLWYLAAILIVRACIGHGLKQVRSPLAL